MVQTVGVEQAETGAANAPRFQGGSRMFDNPRAILVSFDRTLTDGEMIRFLHWAELAFQKVADNLTMAVGYTIAPVAGSSAQEES